jgi:uncharacterized membrane protein
VLRRELLSTRPGRAVAGALVALAVLVVVGLIALWPSGPAASVAPIAIGGAQQAEVERVDLEPCPLSQRTPCQILRARVGDEQARITLPGTDGAPEVQAGDTIRVIANQAGGPEPYAFIDFERRSPLYLLAILFVVLVVALARAKGLRALVGLGLSLVVVTQFIVPAILRGESPLLVALVGALAVMLLTVTLAHGTGVTSVAAVLGSSASLIATALLAVLFVELAQITGFSSEEGSLLRGSQAATGEAQLSLEGLVLAGIVVGALGVLDDVTVSQASTVLALQKAAPAQRFRELFAGALSVGRDHLSATVNTLVLAYVGAALPLLLIFENQGTSFGDALNREVVAGEVVAMLVGSIGLVLAVPLTTALAAYLARLVPDTLEREHVHAHVH